jgi:hypothetical protein
MKLSQGQKIVLGILTILPFLIFPYVFFQIFGFVAETVRATHGGGEPDPTDIMTGIASFIAPILFGSLLSLALLVFYIIHAVNTKTIDTTERVVWIVVFLLFGIIAFPVYWILRVWPEENKSTAQG